MTGKSAVKHQDDAMKRISAIGVLFVALTLAACSSDSQPDPPTLPLVDVTMPAPSTTESVGAQVADLLMSACLTGMSRSDFRGYVADIVTADKVDLFLGEYDKMMKQPSCN